MEIKIKEEQLKKIIDINEDYGIPEEYLENEQLNVVISSPYGELELGKIRSNIIKQLEMVINSTNMMDGNEIMVKSS